MFCGMDHVLRPPAVVTEFIHHDFVGRKVGETFRCEEQRALGQLVAVGAVGKVADRTHGEDELLAGVALHEPPEEGRALRDRQPVARELRSRPLEAVRDRLAGGVEPERPGRAQGDDDLVAAFPEGRCFREHGVRVLKERLRRFPREGRVVPEGAVSPVTGSHLHDLVGRERHAGSEPRDGIADGHGIVQRPERVAQHIEPRRGEPSADFIGKTAAHDGDPVVVGDGHRRRVQGDGGLEFHGNKNTYFLRIFAC